MMTIRSLLLLLCLTAYAPMFGQGHWTCDVRAFQYDMTIFFGLNNRGKDVELNDYEVAAFCGEECRGVAEVKTTDDSHTYGYIRVRSNTANGEQIGFKVYQKSRDAEAVVDETFVFENLKADGYPSSPTILHFNIGLLGDLNADGVVDIEDVMRCTYYGVEGVYLDEADLNGDGVVDILDVMRVTYIAVGKEEE